MVKYIHLLTVIFLFSACEKEQRNIHRMTGVYIIEKIERAYFSNDQLDSTIVDENLGEICLYDNGSAMYNNIYLTMDHYPDAWNVNGVNGAEAKWYTNIYEKINSITFFSEGPASTYFATYTIPKFKSRGKMEWIYFHRDVNGDLDWTETIFVERSR